MNLPIYIISYINTNIIYNNIIEIICIYKCDNHIMFVSKKHKLLGNHIITISIELFQKWSEKSPKLKKTSKIE